MWGGREGDYVSFEAKPSLGFPGARIIGREREGRTKLKRIRANGMGAGTRGRMGTRGGGGSKPTETRLCKKHVIVFVSRHASNTHNESTP